VHYHAAVHVLKYLKGIINRGLYYSAGAGLQVVAYNDADWGTCKSSARPLTDFCVFLG